MFDFITRKAAAHLLTRCKKIVCVGRNYAKHAKELGNEVPSTPVLFMKPASALITQPSAIEVPAGVEELHHEVELGVFITKAGKNIPEDVAMKHIGGFVLCLDMTDRATQNKAKKAGLPWLEAKGRDTWAPISNLVTSAIVPDVGNVRLWCKVNGEMRQEGCTSDMMFSVPFLISHISSITKLEFGDLIMTGTPEGVGPVRPGDLIEAGLQDAEGTTLVEMQFPVVAQPATSKL